MKLTSPSVDPKNIIFNYQIVWPLSPSGALKNYPVLIKKLMRFNEKCHIEVIRSSGGWVTGLHLAYLLIIKGTRYKSAPPQLIHTYYILSESI